MTSDSFLDVAGAEKAFGGVTVLGAVGSILVRPTSVLVDPAIYEDAAPISAAAGSEADPAPA